MRAIQQLEDLVVVVVWPSQVVGVAAIAGLLQVLAPPTDIAVVGVAAPTILEHQVAL